MPPATDSSPRIAHATTPEEIARVYPVMHELRTHRDSADAFVAQVQRQRREGYQLAFLESEGEIRAAAGYRIFEQLFCGKTLYVDDLVTRAADRSSGFGGQLFDWLVTAARREGCTGFTLDSGVQRFDAHRFYLAKRMKIAAHHFSLDL